MVASGLALNGDVRGHDQVLRSCAKKSSCGSEAMYISASSLNPFHRQRHVGALGLVSYHMSVASSSRGHDYCLDSVKQGDYINRKQDPAKFAISHPTSHPKQNQSLMLSTKGNTV